MLKGYQKRNHSLCLFKLSYVCCYINQSVLVLGLVSKDQLHGPARNEKHWKSQADKMDHLRDDSDTQIEKNHEKLTGLLR